MDKNQSKLFELLLELKQICKKNKIDMYLNEKLLYSALNGGEITGNFTEFSVTIKAKDIKKLVSAVNKIENRSIESLQTNKNFPGFHLRYVDEESLFFPLLKYGQYEKMGFAIDINILSPTKTSKFDNVLELGIENLNSLSVSGGLKAKVYACLVFILCLFGKKRLTKKMFNKVNKSTEGKKYYYKKLLSKVEKYDASIFENLKTVTLNGEKFEVPDSAEYIGNRIAGVDSSKLKVNYATSQILDPNMPYKEYFEACKKRKVKVKVVGLSNMIFLLRKVRYQFARRKINKAWDVMFRSKDRFELYDYYKPLKNDILKLYGEKNYDELRKILEPYLLKVEYWYSKKLGLSFDPVIFDILVELLIMDGREKYAKELINMIPKQHKVPMAL